MSKFKLFVFILCFSQILGSRPQNQNIEPFSRFNSVKCTASEISVSSFNCFVKAYSQRNTTLNFIVNISKPLFDLNIRYDFRTKSLSNSQRSLINATFEVCSILNGTGSNPVFQWIIGLTPGLKKMLHHCPYQVCLYIKTRFSK